MLLLLLLSFVGLASAGLYPNSTACVNNCFGSRVQSGNCQQLRSTEVTRYYCPCQAGYFDVPDRCENECDEAHWSLFTYGECVDANDADPNAKACLLTCGTRVRVWTTVFIFVVFVAAVMIIVFLLPMCIASCVACMTTKKERKNRKKQQSVEYAASDVAGAKGGPPSQAATYNPYMYWPQSYYGQR